MSRASLHAEPFRPVLDGAALENLTERLRVARVTPGTDGGWERGTPGDRLATLVADWQAFDPDTLQARLDQFTHLRAEVGGTAVHFIHAPGAGTDPMPGASSLLPYWAHRHTPASALPADDPPPTPTAIDIFGGEIVPFAKPPRELAERYFNVVGWAEHDRGGHFPAVAEPHLLAERLRTAFRPYRGGFGG